MGAGHCLTDPEVTGSYGSDKTGFVKGTPDLVVRPADVEQTAAVVAVCASHGTALVPQGGNTGLVGGSVPAERGVVLSLTRLARLTEVDAAARQVVAGAGVSLEQVQQSAAKQALNFPIDHGARSQATVGGTVATNAGGALAWKHGMTRALIVGTEVVLANGDIVRDMSPLAKDNSGYDLPGLFTGSEGTLGVITAARLRLVPLYPHKCTALVGVDSIGRAVELFLTGRVHPELEATEFFSRRCLELVMAHMKMPAPMPGEHEIYALLEFSGPTVEAAESALAQTAAHIDDDSIVVAQDEKGARSLWEYRERQNEALTAAGGGRKFDVSVMPEQMPDFIDSVTKALEDLDPDVEIYAFGHLGDGNIHLNALGLPDQDAATRTVYETVEGFDGAVSAEHGVGRTKKQWLHLVRSPQEIAAMKTIKNALDPGNLMNPGVLFD